MGFLLTLNLFAMLPFFAKKVNPSFTIRIEMEDEWNWVCLMYALHMHGYKSNTPFSVKWLSYTFLAPSFVGIQIVREINTCGCITQEGNGSQRFHNVMKPFLKEHYYFHENFLQSSHYRTIAVSILYECLIKIQLH